MKCHFQKGFFFYLPLVLFVAVSFNDIVDFQHGDVWVFAVCECTCMIDEGKENEKSNGRLILNWVEYGS